MLNRYSFTVCSNVLVYLVTWLVLHVSGEKDAQIGPGDEEKFQVNYLASLVRMKYEAYRSDIT
jgi:hypothetical protein